MYLSPILQKPNQEQRHGNLLQGGREDARAAAGTDSRDSGDGGAGSILHWQPSGRHSRRYTGRRYDCLETLSTVLYQLLLRDYMFSHGHTQYRSVVWLKRLKLCNILLLIIIYMFFVYCPAPQAASSQQRTLPTTRHLWSSHSASGWTLVT